MEMMLYAGESVLDRIREAKITRMEIALYALSLLFMCLTAYFAIAAFRIRRAVMLKYEEVLWVQMQLEKALAKVESNDEDQILAGCQILSELDDPTMRLEALKTLEKLKKSSNPRVAKEAEVSLLRLMHSPD